MALKIGINGFGRVGKVLLRIIETNNSNIQVNAIKDYNNSGVSDEEYVKNMAYLLQNDSVYGKFPSVVDVDGTKQARYFEQAEYGKYTRAALLGLILNENGF